MSVIASRIWDIFTARRHANALYEVVVCLSVCLSVSVCLWQVGVLLKRLNVGSRKQRDCSFLMPKISAKLKRGHSQRRRQTQVG